MPTLPVGRFHLTIQRSAVLKRKPVVSAYVHHLVRIHVAGLREIFDPKTKDQALHTVAAVA